MSRSPLSGANGPGLRMEVKAYLPPLLVLPGWVNWYVEEPKKRSTVQALPPDVGGVVPDSKPPSLMIVVGQVLRVGVARERVKRVERTVARYIFVFGKYVENMDKRKV